MRTGVEVAVFVTRKSDSEVLIVHRSPGQGGYWHVIAGAVEPGETVAEAAERELHEETGLVAQVAAGVEVTEYVYASRQTVEFRSWTARLARRLLP